MHACMGGMGGGGEVVQGSKVTGDVEVWCASCMGMGSVRAVCMDGWMDGWMEPRESGAGTAERVVGVGGSLVCFWGWRGVIEGGK